MHVCSQLLIISDIAYDIKGLCYTRCLKMILSKIDLKKMISQKMSNSNMMITISYALKTRNEPHQSLLLRIM